MTIALYACAVIAIATVIGFLIFNLDTIFSFAKYVISILNSLVLGLLIAYLLNPIMSFYENKVLHIKRKKEQSEKAFKRTKRFFSIILTFISVLVLISILLLMIVPQIINNFDLLKNNISVYLDTTVKWLDEKIDRIPFISSDFSIEEKITTEKIAAWVTDLAISLGDFVINNGKTIILSIINLVLGIIISLYTLFYKEKLLSSIKKFFKAILPQKTYKSFAETIVYSDRVFGQYIRGKAIDSMIVGILLFIALFIANVPFFGIASLFIAASNMIPYFGPFIGGAPSFLLIFMVDPWKAVLFLVILLVIQQIDANFIDPKIVGDAVGLSALWVIIAVSVFGGIFGFAGMFLAVPIFTVVYNYIKRAVNRRLNKNGLPTDTLYYSDLEAEEVASLPVQVPPETTAVVEYKSNKIEEILVNSELNNKKEGESK